MMECVCVCDHWIRVREQVYTYHARDGHHAEDVHGLMTYQAIVGDAFRELPDPAEWTRGAKNVTCVCMCEMCQRTNVALYFFFVGYPFLDLGFESVCVCHR